MITLKTAYNESITLLTKSEYEKYELNDFKVDIDSYFDENGEKLICVKFTDSELKSFNRSKLMDKMLDE